MKNKKNLTLQETLAKAESPTPASKGSVYLNRLGWIVRIILMLMLTLSPWALGSVSPWAQQYLAFGLLVCLAFWWFETSFNRSARQVVPFLVIPVGIGLLVGLFQLWQLPASIAPWFLGRQIEFYEQFGADLNLEPSVTLSREGTRYFLSLLMLGAAALVMGCRYFRTALEIQVLLTVMTINGVALSFYGMIEKLAGTAQYILWSIPLINGGGPFATYVNRNNAAGFLLITLACSIGLLVILMSEREDRGPRQIIGKEIPFWRQMVLHFLLFVSELNATKLAAIIAPIVIGTGVVGTLSRGGVLALMCGLFMALLCYSMAKKPTFSGFIFLPMIILAAATAGWIGFADRLMERVDQVNLAELNTDGRMIHWQEMSSAFGDLGIFGSGIGSYPGAHRFYRQSAETRIFEYAESQFVQTLFEMGWPGLALLISAWLLLFYCAAFALWNGKSPVTVGIGVMGIFLCTSQAIASAFDFGLYQGANMICMAAIGGVTSSISQGLAGRLKRTTWMRFPFPNAINQPIALALFVGVFLAAIGLHRRAEIQSKREVSPRKFSYQNPDLETTTRLIEELGPLVKRTPISRGLNYLSQLYVHRMRILYYNDAVSISADRARGLPAEERARMLTNLWNLTALENVQENIYSLRREVSLAESEKFRRSHFIQQNLPYAIGALNLSRRGSLMQPKAYIQLGLLYSILGDTNRASKHVEIGIQLAPANITNLELAAIFYLQSGEGTNAAPHIRQLLTLSPQSYVRIESLLNGSRMGNIQLLDQQVIVEDFLPDSPQLIYSYVARNVARDSSVYELGMKKADRLLTDVPPSNHDAMVLSGRVKLALGDRDAAIERLRNALISHPSDSKTQVQLVGLLNQAERYPEAIERLEDLIDFDYMNASKYRKLLSEAKAKLEEKLEREPKTPLHRP